MNQGTLYGTNPATGARLEPAVVEAGTRDVGAAMEAAKRAFEASLEYVPRWSADLLDEIAEQIMMLGDPLLERAEMETALPRPRLIGERARTVNQLKMFAGIVREGSWVDAVIDTADPSRTPQPKPDLRRMLRPRGPAVVFGASNFPFAFGTLGGDTASALAAGCPVVVKGHPSHPGTSLLLAMAADHAVAKLRLPTGTFNLLQGRDHALSAALVNHPTTTAVGFTGSLKAGRALFDLAASRPNPIPVFAEMGSLNPVVVMYEANAETGSEIIKGLAGSLLLGGGQFCTKPGLIFAIVDEGLQGFTRELADEMAKTARVVQLNAALCENFGKRVLEVGQTKGINAHLAGKQIGYASSTPVLFETSPDIFLSEPTLREEMFGPGGIVVRCRNVEEVLACLDTIDGSLTGTVHCGARDPEENVRRVVRKLEQIAGRVIVNGYPTGVEVNNAIVHGGPYPATTDPATTSVGAAAIRRWVRMTAYQDVPDALLPPALQNANPLGIERVMNGVRTRDRV